MLRCWRQASFLAGKVSYSLATRAIRSRENRLVDVTDSPIKHVKILAMNNPPANTLTLELLSDILCTISELCDPDKDECRGIVLTSAIPGIFSMGWDLNTLYTNLERTTFELYWSEIQRLHVTLNTLPVPLVSVISGHAIGVGCTMTLASDYRVMAKRHGDTNLTIGVDAVNCGLTVSPFMAGALAHVVGHRRAEVILQLGELLETSVARDKGLVDETVENADEALIPALMEIEKLSNISPLSYWMAKDLSRKTLVAPLCTPALRATDCESVYEVLNNPDVKRDLGRFFIMEETTELTKTLSDRLKDSSYECAICSECIQLRDKLWSCRVCYGIVHLLCIRSWVKAQTESREARPTFDLSPSSSSISVTDFCCPLCRSRHPAVRLADWQCFCGKVRDPRPDPLLVPGSCGQTCERRRSDRNCAHVCTLMCHPGPCPPCALTRLQSCFCGKAEKPVGCSSGIDGFECDAVCDKVLDCGNHRCTAPCHEGPCAICNVVIEEACFCGSTSRKRRDGDTPGFSCGKICSKQLDCGNHQCASTCHKGPCEPCQRKPEMQKFCFCGKVRINQLAESPRTSCLDPVPSCGLPCDAPLPCGHSCSTVCHESLVCPPCSEILSGKCRCGAQTIRFPCFCTYLPQDKWGEALSNSGLTGEKLYSEYPPKCNKACRKHLSCGKHFCKEVCCTNEDHTCYQICTKRLSCGVHPCGQLCHKGPCPPCSNASYERLFCRCRRTWIEPPVPCGTKPPRCDHVCVVPRPCGHPANHTCHIEEKCPDCIVPVEKRCGSHERVMPYFLPCYRQTISCGKKCGKLLSCCGKACDKTCHMGSCQHKCLNVFPALN